MATDNLKTGIEPTRETLRRVDLYKTYRRKRTTSNIGIILSICYQRHKGKL